jgi:large repetitive protein
LGHFRSLEAVFGLLEPRILLAAQPVVEVSDAKPFIGDSGSFTVKMKNDNGGGGIDRTGFQPYVDLIIPHTGADGRFPGSPEPENKYDGVTVTSASVLGAAIDPQVVTFDAAGKATHPFARDSNGNLRVVQASDFKDSLGNILVKPGDQLVVLDLPFGSLVPEQPEMTITVNFSLSDHADLGVALPVFAQGGFAFGRDPFDNPTADHPVLGAKDSGTITPSLFTLSKSFNGPEGETATGPNFPRSFNLNFDIATGQNVLNPVFIDTLPAGVVVVGTPTMTTVSGSPVLGSVVYNPESREVTFKPNGPLTGVSGIDVKGTINFYVKDILNPGTGLQQTLENNLSGTLGWIPIDPRDPSNTFSQDPSGPEASFVAKSIATQKGVTLFTDVGATGVGPGDTLKYTINIQVSDYFEFQNLKVRDILSDGQTFVAGSARLTATEAGITTGVDFELPNITPVETAGVTTLDLNISGQLGGNGVLTGGLFPTGLTNQGATTLQITYLTTIDTRFNNNTVVSQGDSVSNSVTVQGDIRDAAGVVTQTKRSDDSGSSIGIATGSLSKEVYAINNVILTGSTSDVKVKTYDLVTYRLAYNLPQSILGKLEFTDFLPLPIFDADVFHNKSLQIPGSSSSLPGENTIQYGPSSFSSSFMSVTGNATPAISVDSDANSFGFVFTNLNPSPTVATTADFLFTVRVADDPFGDGLKLTNQVTSQEYKHGDIKSVFSTAIKQITLTEPNLAITKGVIQTDNNGGTFTLASQGPVTFTEPGDSTAPRFTGTINSDNLKSKPVNSDLNNIDGRDLVSFGIVVENKGSSAGGAFDVKITDTMPFGFSIPTSVAGLNLRVTDGAGNAIAIEDPSDAAINLFSLTGIKLVDDNTNNIGALKPYHGTNGQNIVVITYDLLSDDLVQPKQVMKNTANVINYAAREGGANYILERGPLKDDATVTTAIPQALKTVFETSLIQTGMGAGLSSLHDLAIGETITYEITATLPEGNIKGFNILDVLEQSPQKLTYLPDSASVVWIGGPGGIGNNLFTDEGWTTPLTSTGISHSNGIINFGFTTDVYNRPDNQVTDADRVKVRLTAFVPNVTANVAGEIVTNTGIVEYKEAAAVNKTKVESSVNAEIVEPIFDLKKDTTTSIVERGDQVIYTVTLKNAAVASALPGSSNPQGVFSAPAFDVTIDDGLLPGKLTLVPGTAQIMSAGTTATASVSEVDVGGNKVVRITSAEIMPGKQIQFQYTAEVSASVEAGTNLVNTVTLKGDSHPMTPTPPDQRPYSLSATETVKVKSPTLSKTVAATSIEGTDRSFHDANLVDLAIGEIVTYRITVTAPEAVTTNFKVIDTLPFASQVGFKAIEASMESKGSNLSIGSGKPVITLNDTTATFDFGTVTANAADQSDLSANQISLLVKARVENVAGDIKDGVKATNEAKLTFGSIGQQATANVTVDIVEPKLQINKAITNPSGFVKPGETVDYTVTVRHLSSSTAPAFDLDVKDLISDPYLALVAGSVSALRGTSPWGTVVSGNGAGDTTLRVTADKLLRNDASAAGDVWTISFKAKVLPTTPGGVTINNTATSSFDSAPGVGGRPDGGSAAASIPGSPSLEKTIISTSNPDTGSSYFDPTLPDLTIGEKLTYRMVMTLPQGLTQNVSITDLLPAGLTPLEARLVSLGSLSAGTPAISISGQTVTVTFGNVTNSTGAPIGAEDRITIDVDARVKDLPGLVAGNKLTNAAQADFKIGDRTSSLIAAASAEVVEAKLAIDKQVTPTTVTLGETFTYSVILSHEAASTAPAYNVVVKDLLSDPNLRLQSGSVFASVGLVSTGNAPGDQNIKIDLAKLMPGEVLRVSFQAKIETMPLPNGLVSNTATFGFVSTPDTSLPSTFIRSGSGSDSADILVATPSLRPSDQSPLSAYQEAFKRIRHGYWELPIVLAGTAEPGAAVGLEIRDATGAPVSVVGITADVGGHWMAPPIFTSAMPAQDLDALASLRSLAGRQTAPAGETPLSQPLPAAWLPTTTSAPYTVLTSEAGPAFMKEGFKRNMDVTFNGVVDSEGAIASDPAQAFMVEKSASSTWSNRPSSAPPGSLVWNSFARDFAINRQLGR